MSEEREESPLTPSGALYGTGVAGMFSDSLTNRYISLLAVSVGVTVSQMSYLRAAQSLSRNLLQLLWGRLADHYGKKMFISLGRILNGLLLGVLIFVRTPTWLILLVIGIAICWSLIPSAWSSLLGDYTTYTSRGTAIGRINGLSQAGGLIAMIIVFVISLKQVEETTPESYTLLLAMAAVMSVMSGIFSLLTEEKPPSPKKGGLDIALLFRDPRLRRYFLANIVYGISMAFAWPLFPFIIVDKLAMKIWQIAAYSICSSTSSMIAHRYFGNLMDRIGRRPVIVFSRLSMAVAPLIYVFATSWTHVIISEVILGVGMGAWMSSSPTYIIDISPPKLRATYLATNTAVFGVAAFIGNLASGYITDNFLAVGGGFQGIHMGLLISAALRFLTGLLYLWIYETYSPDE
jgi:MFS family permease